MPPVHRTDRSTARGLVPHRQPGPLRRGDLAQVAEQSPADRRRARARPARAGAGSSGSRCSPTPTRSAALCSRRTPTTDCVGVIAWMHTFTPAKMWIAGLDALRKPLLHLHTQANVALPWADIDMDFMNLNQAAHGDREFGYIQTRLGVPRKTVVGHVSDPAVAAADRRLGARRRRPAPSCARLRLARFGDNMRDVAVTEGDKVEASCASASRSTPTASTTWPTPSTRPPSRRSTRWSPSTRTPTTSPRSCGPAASGTSRCATRARHRARPARVPRPRRLRRLHHQLRGPRRAAPAAGPGRAAADGRRLRLRRRGRLEDRGAGARR